MRVFIERFVLAILAPLVVLLAVTNPVGFSWPLKIIGVIVIVVVAGIAAHFAGWEEWRWERLRGMWWLWAIFGLSGGVAVTLWWLTPSVNGMGILTAIDTFAPADLKRDYDEPTKELKDVLQKIESTNNEMGEMDGNPPPPEYFALQKRLSDLTNTQGVIMGKRWKARDKAIANLRDQLRNGTLLAEAYDQDKQTWIVIPTDEWEYLQLGVEGGDLKEIGHAGGAGRHLTGVLLGKGRQWW